MNEALVALDPASLAAQASPLWRHDDRSARIVDIGISLQQRFGINYAAAFLKENGIPVDVALRVLSQPEQRRKLGREARTGLYSKPA